MLDLGAELRRCRDLKGWSRAKLAEESGVSKQTIRHWEGKNPPAQGQKPNVIALATTCGMDVNEALKLAGYEPEPEVPMMVAAAVIRKSREQLKAELLAMWPKMDDHLCQVVVAVAGIGMGQVPLQSLPAVSIDGHRRSGAGNSDGVARAPQHHDHRSDDLRAAWGFRCSIIPKEVAARIAAEVNQDSGRR